MLSRSFEFPRQLKVIFAGMLSYAAVYFVISIFLIERAARADPTITQVNPTTGVSLELVLSIAAAIITLLLAIVSYFLVSKLNDFTDRLKALDVKIDTIAAGLTAKIDTERTEKHALRETVAKEAARIQLAKHEVDDHTKQIDEHTEKLEDHAGRITGLEYIAGKKG